MTADHDRWQDSAAAYLLGALPDDEADGFEAHLATCTACRAELDELAPAVRALPSSVEPVAPPAALKSRIMAEVEREASLLAAAGPEADRPPAPARPRRRLLPRFGARPALAFGLGVVLLIAVGVGVTQLSGNGERTVQAQILDTSRAPDAGAEVDVASNGATLVAHGLPAPPSGRVYQVWLKRPGYAPEATSALFTPRSDGTATASVPGSMDGVAQVLVTDEPAGGSRQPTSDPLIVAKMS
jgi:anti-sigma factor RsiW